MRLLGQFNKLVSQFLPYYYIFKDMCFYFGKIVKGVKFSGLFVAQHPHQFGD
jgi:hypothetical protein